MFGKETMRSTQPLDSEIRLFDSSAKSLRRPFHGAFRSFLPALEEPGQVEVGRLAIFVNTLLFRQKNTVPVVIQEST